MNRLAVIGLGKLGGCMACVFAEKGFDVVGIDVSEKLIQKYQMGQCPIEETGLNDLYQSVRRRIEFTTDFKEIKNCDTSFIIVPTPSDRNGSFVNDYVLEAVQNICDNLNNDYHNIVITSTVMPGTMENLVKPLIENATGRTVGVGVGLCYSPEFIALGSVIQNMKKPDSVLIGESDPLAGELLEQIYKKVCLNDPPVRRMTFWNAEVAKLSLNVFLTLKISAANTFAELCEAVPSGNVDVVTDFIGLDSRIGHKFLKGGLGFMGTCLPRDCRAFVNVAEDFKVNHQIPTSSNLFNDAHTNYIRERIKILNDGILHFANITILGVTYKPNTPIVEESTAIKLISQLRTHNSWVKVYDPMGMENAAKELFRGQFQTHSTDTGNGSVLMCGSVNEALEDSELCVVMTAWDEFKALTGDRIKALMAKPIVYDCWRILDKEDMLKNGVEYHALGVNDG